MFKIFVLALGTAFGVSSAVFLSGPVLTYSGAQGKLPLGSGIKVLPDGTNIWTWHHEQIGDGTVEVVVDFDKNGKMDSELECFRVLITDMQVTYRWQSFGPGDTSIALVDDQGTVLWQLFNPDRNDLNLRTPSTSEHLSTPLPVPTGSKLHLVVSGFGSVQNNIRIRVRLIGRLVNV